MKKIAIILIMLFLLVNNVYGAENDQDIVDLNNNYSYEELYNFALQLEARYPDIISLEVIGKSNDSRNIFVLVMGDDIINTLSIEDNYVNKMHFFSESGTHGRENVGPIVIMKTIETYAKDYYNDEIIKEYNVKELLENNVLHFIPLVNPDGYDLTTQGISSISYEYRLKLRTYRDWRFDQYKSNLNGVDINRNYPGYYYDVQLGKWRDIWNMIHNDNRSFRPSGAFFFGPYAGSEIETQVMMEYLMKYDFRNYLSYHNRGNVIYFHKWMLSSTHNDRAEELAIKASELSSYQIIYTDRTTSSSGYMSDYVSMNTLKPVITLELNYAKIKLPVKPEYFLEEYEETRLIPLSFVEIGRSTGYFKYRLYQDGVYIRDFEEKIYASKYAEEYGGVIIEGIGRPVYYLDDKMNKITRLEFIKKIMGIIEDDTNPRLFNFSDCRDLDILKARALGIVSGYQNKFRPYDYVSYGEFYSIVHSSFFSDYVLEDEDNINLSKLWFFKSFLVLVENGLLDYADIRVGEISEKEVFDILDLLDQSN